MGASGGGDHTLGADLGGVVEAGGLLLIAEGIAEAAGEGAAEGEGDGLAGEGGEEGGGPGGLRDERAGEGAADV